MSGGGGDDDPPPASPRRMLIGLLAFAVAIVLVLFMVHRLQDAARLQDCVAAGRTNCAPIDAGGR
jgi:hypothetical protein